MNMQDNNRETLLRAILDWAQETIQSAAFADPVVFLCIAYDPACEGFPPPTLGLGTESERQDLASDPSMLKSLSITGDLAREDFYNPSYYKNFSVPPLTGTRGAIEALGEKLAENDSWDWDDFYLELGRRMTAIPWSRWLRTTRDFVSFTTEIQLGSWGQSFATIVPRHIRQTLAQNGWIPKSVAG